MSKQMKTYLLLATVLIIWGIIIYRFVDAFSSDEPSENEAFKVSSFEPTNVKSIDTFSIAKLERDPFLGKTYVKHAPKKSPVKKSKPEIRWPNIVYRGLVSGGSNIFVIDVGGQQFLFSPNDTNAEVTLVRGRPDQVVLQFGKERKTFSIVE